MHSWHDVKASRVHRPRTGGRQGKVVRTSLFAVQPEDEENGPHRRSVGTAEVHQGRSVQKDAGKVRQIGRAHV